MQFKEITFLWFSIPGKKFVILPKTEIMSNQEIRDEIYHYIENADDVFLEMVYALSKAYHKQHIVGYETDGRPLTQDGVKDRVKAASKRVKSGDFITQEAIEKEMEKW